MRFPNGLNRLGAALLAGAALATATAMGCGGGDDSAASGGGTAASCVPKKPVCNAIPSACFALADNKGKTKFGLRMSQLNIEKPAVLSKGFIAKTVALGVTMNLTDCYLNGTGAFSWLLEFDTQTGKLRTGGATRQPDPQKGYCFANMTVGSFQVQPIEVDAHLMDGKFEAESDTLIAPIFLDSGGAPLILPLHKAHLYDGALSPDNDCIGKSNAAALDPNNLCLPDDTHDAYINGAKLSAYFLLEETDKIIVPDAGNESLCAILSGDVSKYGTGGSPNVCKRDQNMKILLKGDWCSATNSPATAECSDAIAVGAEFAASAVQITGICP